MARKDENSISSYEARLHEMMHEIASDLLNPSQSTFNSKMSEILKKIATFLNLDCLFVSDHYEDLPKGTHFYNFQHLMFQNHNLLDLPIRLIGEQLLSKHQKDLPLIVEDADAILNDSPLYPFFESTSMKSFYAIPLIQDHVLIGYIALIDYKSKRQWTMTEHQLLDTFSKWIAHAIVREKIDHEMLELKKKAQSSNETKTEFLSNMSHEIRTPLSGIYNAFYLIETTELTQDQKSYLDLGRASIDQLSILVDQIFHVVDDSKETTMTKHEPFHLEDEMNRLYLSQKHLAEEKGLIFHLDFDYNIKTDFLTDGYKLKQILMHLLSNAFKFTHEGQVKLKIEKLKEKDFLKFSVIDTGIGMDPNSLDELTEIFHQEDTSSKRSYQGAGLGLSIVSDLIVKLDSKLDIESELNRGSTFSFEMPYQWTTKYDYQAVKDKIARYFKDQTSSSDLEACLSSMGIETQSEHEKTVHADFLVYEKPIKDLQEIKMNQELFGHAQTVQIARLMPQNRKFKGVDLWINMPTSRNVIYQELTAKLSTTIKQKDNNAFKNVLSGYALVVDDNRLNRIALESILHKQGVRSKSAKSGVEAIEAVKNEHFDIILMDVQMPMMDGIEATRRIRALGKKYQSIPIIAITANAFFNDYDLMKNVQINDVIFKPIDVEHLTQVLRKFINTGTHIQIPDELSIFDEKDFEARFLGSEDIAKEVMTYFIEVYQVDLDKIADAVLKKDEKEIIETAHYFKGSCSYLSAKRVVWLLQLMMEQAKNRQLELMSTCLELLKIETKLLVKEIEKKIMSKD
jgi:signal transduction histidine kinase/CheY-like chemotaxis protein/HPt (histidine-containing phosphotransfer) domain-containing protein